MVAAAAGHCITGALRGLFIMAALRLRSILALVAMEDPIITEVPAAELLMKTIR